MIEKTDKIVFRKDLYPRIDTSPQTVQQYAENLDVMPPIEINQHKELIDGWHRWTAHKKMNREEIAVTVTETASEAEFIELAIVRNAAHGMQLSARDKKEMARRLYLATDEKNRASKKDALATLLSVTPRSISSWLSDIDRDAKESRNEKIRNLWLACYTQEEIAAAVGCGQKTIDRVSVKMESFPKRLKLAAEFEDGYAPEIYNIWSFAKKTNEVQHFGNTEARIVESLLWAYTKPFDIVVDPFAGGGSTIDVCKRRLRRYFVSDRLPIVEREHEIRKHDIADGVLKPPRWQDVALVYLDPPYWRQAKGKYSDDTADLANMDEDDFHNALGFILNEYTRKLQSGSHIALIIQPTQWLSNENHSGWVDHVIEMIRFVTDKLKLINRISCPYSTQQYTAQMVNYAKENRIFLALTRELVVWEVQ